jgi:hypothetical protein
MWMIRRRPFESSRNIEGQPPGGSCARGPIALEDARLRAPPASAGIPPIVIAEYDGASIW